LRAIELIQKGDLEGFKALLSPSTPVGSIRGKQLPKKAIKTSMWNAFHFAVYYKKIDIVRYMLEEMRPHLPSMVPLKLLTEETEEGLEEDQGHALKICIAN